MLKNVTPRGSDAASCDRQTILHLKRASGGDGDLGGPKVTVVALPWKGASAALQRPELKPGCSLCSKHKCCGLKEWKLGSSRGFGGLSPPARQPMALGSSMVSAHHGLGFSSLSFSCLSCLGSVRANTEKENICNSRDVKLSELAFTTDTERYSPKFNS